MNKNQKKQAFKEIKDSLYKELGEVTCLLTNRQAWMLNYLYNQWLQNKKRWVSPTEVGREYGFWVHQDDLCPLTYHSSTASPILKILVNMRLIERNEEGHYRYLKKE